MVQRRQTEKSVLSRSRHKELILIGLFAMLLIAAVVLFWLYATDAFRGDPEMEIFPDNTYAETLHVVTDADYEPFSYLNEEGLYMGFDVELMAEIANRMEMNLDLTLTDWTTANEMLLSGEADILMNMETDSVVADDRLIASIPTIEKQYVVYGREEVSSVAELYQRRIASLHALPQLGLEDYITYMDSYDAIFTGLRDGQFDFAICPIQVGNTFLAKLQLSHVKPSYAVSHVYGALALRAGSEDLRNRLDSVIQELQEEGFLEGLDDKWVNHHYENTTLIQMLANHPKLGAGMFFVAALLILAFILLFMMQRSSAAKDAYTQQLKHQSEELLEAKERAESAGRAKTTFLFNMSHDIRTPMNAIISYTDLALREDTTDAEARSYMEKVQTSGKQLLVLINDVLEMSRIESGKTELVSEDTNLRDVLRDAKDLFATQMEAKRITFLVEEKIEDAYVSCDRNLLNRILLNLLSNAYKFTPEGGKVAVTLAQTGRSESQANYELTVQDNGIGMNEEFAKRVFDAFERERTSTVSGIQGTGLGMAITKRIVELMGGTITVDTAPGKGTTFHIILSLPVTEAPAEPEITAEEETVDFTGIRVLLVEDNEINREIAKLLLSDAGFVLDEAVNGQEAVDKIIAAEAGTYRAILMDIQMPVMNGYEATRAIRALDDPEKAGIPIVAMTANAFAEDIQEAKDAGMNGHLAKPIEIPKMMETLRQVCYNTEKE